MPVPAWRLAAAAAFVAAAVLVLPGAARAWLLVLDGALLVVAAADWWLAPRPRDLVVERELPGVVGLDDTGEVVWRVANHAGRRARVRLADELAPSLRPATRRPAFDVPARGRATARAPLNPSRRGRFSAREVVLRVEGPLRLVARQSRRDLPGVVRVYPPFRSRREAELRLSKARILEVGLRAAQGRGGGTDFDSLREYTVDDEFRRIDWAATARASRPIVRTYRAERNQSVLCLLDTGRVMAGRVAAPATGDMPVWDVPRLDHAMDAVMMLTAVSTRLGDRAGLVAFADTVRSVVAPGHTRDQLSRVTEAMYDLDPVLAESDYRGAFASTLGRFRRRALLVVFTELAEQAVAESLVPALPLVVRDHVVLVASVRDPEVDRWAAATPSEATTAFRKAAATETLASRRRTVARLRGLGAVVVDAPPGRLAPQLADAYLRVKATGRL